MVNNTSVSNFQSILNLVIAEGKRKHEIEKNSIIFTKIQVNTNFPAIARLKIEFGTGIRDTDYILNEISKYCNSFVYKDIEFPSVSANVIANSNFILIETKESKEMYSFFRSLTKELKEFVINGSFNIVIKGCWDNGDDFLPSTLNF